MLIKDALTTFSASENFVAAALIKVNAATVATETSVSVIINPLPQSEIAPRTSTTADSISINPMSYVDKKLIAYPHPTKNYVNPYVTSRYSGMMFNAVV